MAVNVLCKGYLVLCGYVNGKYNLKNKRFSCYMLLYEWTFCCLSKLCGWTLILQPALKHSDVSVVL